MLLSDANADDFVDRTSLTLFRDPAAGRPAWIEMEMSAFKHDTFVFDKTGTRSLFWDATSNSLGAWTADIRAAVEAVSN